jgi:DNA adenine methylase
MIAKPFLKWAGGKSKLIPEIINILPKDFGIYNTYVEPFLGSGALLFWILQSYPNIEKAIINDINEDLINSYKTIRDNPDSLLNKLNVLQKNYKDCKKLEDKSNMFYDIRKKFNMGTDDIMEKTSYLIFLNKTCFNGLFRVNSKNEFNVPFNKNENPTICDEENIINVSKLLKNVEILNVDYSKTIEYIKEKTLFYFDPPYKPLSKTASFNSYSKDVFNDDEQKRLKEFCDMLSTNKIKWILSNSDLKNVEPNNNFFDDLYVDYNIRRVSMKRQINSNASKRGDVFELLINNY